MWVSDRDTRQRDISSTTKLDAIVTTWLRVMSTQANLTSASVSQAKWFSMWCPQVGRFGDLLLYCRISHTHKPRDHCQDRLQTSRLWSSHCGQQQELSTPLKASKKSWVPHQAKEMVFSRTKCTCWKCSRCAPLRGCRGRSTWAGAVRCPVRYGEWWGHCPAGSTAMWPQTGQRVQSGSACHWRAPVGQAHLPRSGCLSSWSRWTRLQWEEQNQRKASTGHTLGVSD